jgi:hypothetical protein
MKIPDQKVGANFLADAVGERGTQMANAIFDFAITSLQ